MHGQDLPDVLPLRAWPAVALANSLTFANGIAGLAAILLLSINPTPPGALSAGLAPAAILIFVAYAFDGLDGVVARRLGIAGPSGAIFDSLCDVVSFGVAPAVMLVAVAAFAWPGSSLVVAAVLVAALYFLAVVFRLTRFTTKAVLSEAARPPPQPASLPVFAGMPSPAAAMILAASALLFVDQPSVIDLPAEKLAAPTMLVAGIITAVLMVSRLPFPDLLKIYLRGSLPRWHLLLLAGGALIAGPAPALVILGLLYSFFGPSLSRLASPMRSLAATRTSSTD